MSRVLLVCVLLLVVCGAAFAGETVVVTTAADGTPANAAVDVLKLSGDGRVAAFITAADNLVPGDTNGTRDLFRKDLATGEVWRVSRCADGSQLNADVTSMAVSQDGAFLTFVTCADAFTPSGPLLAKQAIYLTEEPSGSVQAVFRDAAATGPAAGGIILNSISADGSRIAFSTDLRNGELDPTDTDIYMDVYVWDRGAGFILASVNTAGEKGNFGSSMLQAGPSMTPDGRHVVFASGSTNMVAGDTNDTSDVFLRDTQEGTTTRVSLRSDGGQVVAYNGIGCGGAAISSDGNYVSFTSACSVTGLPAGTYQAFVRDLVAETTEAVSTNGVVMSNASCWGSYVSSGAVHIAIFQSTATNLVPGLTGGESLIYERDLTHDSTDLVSCVDDGQVLVPTNEGEFSPSEDGAIVAFVAEPTSSLFPRSLPRVGPAQGYRRTRGPFWDVGSRHWAVTGIEACYAAGIVSGYGGGSYRPAQQVTRDQMAVYIARALAGSDGAVPAGPEVATFQDVPTDHWAYRYVEYAVSEGVVGGYGDLYRPTLVVTRDAMAVFVARGMAGGDSAVPSGPETASFTDVPTDHWAFRYVEYCRAEGVVGGYGDGSYRPVGPVDRAAMAVYVERGFLR